MGIHSETSYKQLYSRQQCYYSALVSSIHFNNLNRAKFNYEQIWVRYKSEDNSILIQANSVLFSSERVSAIKSLNEY